MKKVFGFILAFALAAGPAFAEELSLDGANLDSGINWIDCGKTPENPICKTPEPVEYCPYQVEIEGQGMKCVIGFDEEKKQYFFETEVVMEWPSCANGPSWQCTIFTIQKGTVIRFPEFEKKP